MSTERKRIDAYVCPELHVIITEISEKAPVNSKIMPRIGCPQCGQPAQSQGFNVNQSFKASIEWYCPDENEIKAASLKMDKPEYNRFVEYVNKGGLLSRLKNESDINNQHTS